MINLNWKAIKKMADENKPSNTFERHAQTALVGIIILLIGWVGVTVNGNDKTLLGISVTMKYMQQDIVELKTKDADRFTGKEGRELRERVRRIEEVIRDSDFKTDSGG